ncbi:MAG TPA: hypothetical protein VND68_06145 [Chloroflexia bacterium]|nr:hypothetical protein [Chloroflexia bacterium]
MNRPLGVTILAIAAVLYGIYNFIRGLAWLGLGAIVVTSLGFSPETSRLGGLTAGVGALFLLGGLVWLAFAMGAFRLQSWAWMVGVAATTLSLLGSVIELFDEGARVGAILGVVVALLILVYLFSSDVRKAFHRA